MDTLRQTIIAHAEVATGQNLNPLPASQRVCVVDRRSIWRGRVGPIVERAGSEALVRVCKGVNVWFQVSALRGES